MDYKSNQNISQGSESVVFTVLVLGSNCYWVWEGLARILHLAATKNVGDLSLPNKMRQCCKRAVSFQTCCKGLQVCGKLTASRSQGIRME